MLKIPFWMAVGLLALRLSCQVVSADTTAHILTRCITKKSKWNWAIGIFRIWLCGRLMTGGHVFNEPDLWIWTVLPSLVTHRSSWTTSWLDSDILSVHLYLNRKASTEMARGVTTPAPSQLPKVSFTKVQDDILNQSSGVHDQQARSYGCKFSPL